MANRYVALGLANVRSAWFRDVGRWATAAAIPVDFVKCVSVEEVRARLGSGRAFSALLFDAGMPGVDRDLVEVAVETGAAVFVVRSDHSQRDWLSLGATAILPQDFDRAELMDELVRHARPLDRIESRDATLPPSSVPSASWAGHIITVVSGSGAGGSTVAMGLSQGLADDPRFTGLTVLADFCLNADLAMLHDARDIVPGVQEMVDAHRAGNPSITEVRGMVFDASDRGYHLLLGLRRHRDWSVLRPRAVAATIESLSRSYRAIVVDIDADLEGEDETGAVDVEERNLLARTAAQKADLVLAVGTPSMKGLHDLLRVIGDLTRFGVEPGRILPVLNRSGRPGRQRSEIAAAFGELVAPISSNLPSPLHLPERRRMDDALRDNLRLPSAFTKTLAEAVTAITDRNDGPDFARTEPEPVVVLPGSLGHFAEHGIASEDVG